MVDLTSLNENQEKAVSWVEGPLLVLAGPGSGKTRVLTYRIARLIEATPDDHFRLLGLTFTNKAAAEMRHRIAALVPGAESRTLLTTFHSFAADILRQHGHHLGLKPDFTILVQDAERHSLLEEAIDKGKVTHLNISAERLLPLISRMIENDITRKDALGVLKKRSLDNAEAISSVYRNYRDLMIENNALDFPGLIAEALALLEGLTGVRKQIQRIYPYVSVDEFQDTNLLQYKILCHLVNEGTRNLFIVADDDQMIYQWNGASLERLEALRADFNMDLLQLPENYRCPDVVVRLANNLIANNFSRFEQKEELVSYKRSSSRKAVTVRNFAEFSEEAKWVAQSISKYPVSNRAECVVLSRTRKLLDEVLVALEENEVAGYLAVRKNEFESASLRWLHSILRLANSRDSREYLSRVCKAFFTLEGVDLNVRDIMSDAQSHDGDFVRSWARAALSRLELSEDTRQMIKTSIVPVLADRLDLWQFERDAFAWLDGLPNISPDVEGVFSEYAEEKDTWEKLIGEITGQYGSGVVTLHLLLQELDLRSKAPPVPKNGVPCFTIHGSKGMEFKHVYLVGLVEDQLPSWAALKKGDNSRELQEERRNCFVAITRAQESLTLTYSDYVQGWRKKPSRFLEEMGLL